MVHTRSCPGKGTAILLSPERTSRQTRRRGDEQLNPLRQLTHHRSVGGSGLLVRAKCIGAMFIRDDHATDNTASPALLGTDM